MTHPLRVAIVLVGLAATSRLVAAHHSIAAVYDSKRSLTVEGTVAEFHFVNPHPYLLTTVAGDDGIRSTWHMEMDNLGELAALGISARTFQANDRIVVTGSRSRVEPRSLYVRRLIRATDGLEYEQVGSSPQLRRR